MVYVAADRMDSVLELNARLWDVAVGFLLVQKMGGQVYSALGMGESMGLINVKSWCLPRWVAYGKRAMLKASILCQHFCIFATICGVICKGCLVNEELKAC